MKVKLLKDIKVNGKIKVVAKRGRKPIAYFADTEIECSEETGKKWIEQGIAKRIP